MPASPGLADAPPGPLSRLRRRLARPVDGASLAAFRVLFAALLVIGTLRFAARGWIAAMYIDPAYHFPYWGFGWVRPWPGVGMYLHFAALALAGLALALGLRPRLAALVCFILFTHAELIDKAAYLNHYYFVSVVLLLLVFLPTRADRPAPAWALYALRLQVGLVYGFAGLAKLRGDWLLRAQPLRTWLAAHADFPLLGPLLARPETATFMSWAGAAFDLSVPFLLLHPRTRVPAYLALLGFHGLTGALFPIGMFPWLMSASALIFFPPGWPRRLLRALRRPVPTDSPPVPADSPPVPADIPALSRLGLLALTLHFTGQFTLPLRHHLYPGDHGWSEEGWRFAWHVMLVEKAGTVSYRVRDPQTGRVFVVHPEDDLTAQQAAQMAIAPDMILDYAHHLAAQFAARGVPGVEVRADAFVVYNGRPGARLIDPTVDLARERDGLGPKRWILPAP